MIKQRIFLLLLLLTFLAGCGKTPSELIIEPTSTQVELAPSATAESTPTESPQVYQLPDPPANRTQYKLDLIFNYYSHFGSVTQQITYTNKSSQPLAEILLVVPPRNFEGSYEQYSLSSDLLVS